MAHAYTPGLRVTGHTTVLKQRRLPMKGEVLVEKGKEVKANDVVARTALPGNVHTLNVANMLSLPPEDVRACMIRKEGDQVEKDETIAEAKSFFGLFKSTAKAPITGTIENISKVTGQITLREAPIPVEVLSWVDGVVDEVIPEEGVVVETTGALLQGIFGIGGERVGTLLVAAPDHKSTAAVASLGDLKGKVVVLGSHASHDEILKARDAGAVGVIAGGLSDADLKRILGFDLGVAITGSEEIGLTVIVTEGFGDLPIAQKTYDLLKSLEGKQVSINGATQIRAGVMRPEMLVPLPENRGKPEGDSVFASGLQPGMIVRLIRQPHFGELGVVTELPAALESLESEAKVRVLRVKMDDGTVSTVPRANVEMIES